jgi:hypothetical protein
MTLSIKEKEELVALAKSSSFKEDMQYLAAHRHTPLIVDGKVDLDRYITFVTEYNAFINHQPKPFKPIIDKMMKL